MDVLIISQCNVLLTNFDYETKAQTAILFILLLYFDRLYQLQYNNESDIVLPLPFGVVWGHLEQCVIISSCYNEWNWQHAQPQPEPSAMEINYSWKKVYNHRIG